MMSDSVSSLQCSRVQRIKTDFDQISAYFGKILKLFFNLSNNSKFGDSYHKKKL